MATFIEHICLRETQLENISQTRALREQMRQHPNSSIFPDQRTIAVLSQYFNTYIAALHWHNLTTELFERIHNSRFEIGQCRNTAQLNPHVCYCLGNLWADSHNHHLHAQ